jgi:hypothetical protein
LLLFTEKQPHRLDQLCYSIIADPVKDEIGVLAEINNTMASQYGEVLGNVGIGGPYLVSDVSHRHFPLLEQAEDFEPNGMGY